MRCTTWCRDCWSEVRSLQSQLLGGCERCGSQQRRCAFKSPRTDGQTMACPSLVTCHSSYTEVLSLSKCFMMRFVKTHIKYRMDISLSPMALYTLNSTLYAIHADHCCFTLNSCPSCSSCLRSWQPPSAPLQELHQPYACSMRSST